MNRSISILVAFSIVLAASGCAEQPQPIKSGNTPEVQRAHAEKAQGELSSEVKK